MISVFPGKILNLRVGERFRSRTDRATVGLWKLPSKFPAKLRLRRERAVYRSRPMWRVS